MLTGMLQSKLGATFRAKNTARRIAVCASGLGDTSEIVHMIEFKLGYKCTVLTDCQSSPEKLVHIAKTHDLALVNVSAINDADCIIDLGFKLRQIVPDLPVVLMSSQFQSSDFSTERFAICDASLRLPTGSATLQAAIQAALTNHARYTTRAQQMAAVA